MMNLQRLACTLFMMTTMALAGCGGGGGGGDSVPSGSVFGDLNTTQEVADNIVTAIGKAASATPRAGSVTQSSNVDSGGITTDQVEVTAEYGASGPSFEVRNGTAWSIGMGEGNPSPISDTTPPWKGAELSKQVSGGTVYVEAYTDIQAPETRQVDSSNDGTRDVQLGTMILGANVTIVVGGSTSQTGMLDGEPGTFNCPGGCRVTNGSTTRGMWTFTPDRPPGAMDVLSSDTVTFSSADFDGLTPFPGTRNGQQGNFRCLSALTSGCGHARNNSQQSLNGDWIFIPTSGTTTVTDLDTDYLAGGVWLFVPANATSTDDYVFGAFVDGSDPFDQSNIMPLTGTATYKGAATGVYSATDGQSTDIGSFNGDVELMADFGGGSDLGTIGGSLTNLEVDGDRVASMLNFGTAHIGSQNSGFFEGGVTGVVGSNGTDYPERTYTGSWGGQFFGNNESDGKPGAVGGTFGGNSTDDAVNFVGAFGAQKQ